MIKSLMPGLQAVLGVTVMTERWGRRQRMPYPGLGVAAAPLGTPLARGTAEMAA